MSMPLSCTCVLASTFCGPGQRHDQAEKGKVAERGQHAARLNLPRAQERAEKAQARILNRGGLPPPAPQEGEERQQEEQRQDPGMGELNIIHAGFATRLPSPSGRSAGLVAVTKETARSCTRSSSGRPGR